MTIISKDNKFLTLINIFVVEPLAQQQFVELLIKATNDSIRHVKSFIWWRSQTALSIQTWNVCMPSEPTAI